MPRPRAQPADHGLPASGRPSAPRHRAQRSLRRTSRPRRHLTNLNATARPLWFRVLHYQWGASAVQMQQQRETRSKTRIGSPCEGVPRRTSIRVSGTSAAQRPHPRTCSALESPLGPPWCVAGFAANPPGVVREAERTNGFWTNRGDHEHIHQRATRNTGPDMPKLGRVDDDSRPRSARDAVQEPLHWRRKREPRTASMECAAARVDVVPQADR